MYVISILLRSSYVQLKMLRQLVTLIVLLSFFHLGRLQQIEDDGKSISVCVCGGKTYIRNGVECAHYVAHTVLPMQSEQ